jgi:signal peptidase I
MADDSIQKPPDLTPAQAPLPDERIRANGPPARAAGAPAAKPGGGKAGPGTEPKDSFRELVETVVFVVVLVLLLKGFLAEAFVIPTGSMATTLLGYHRDVTCPTCRYPYPVNYSQVAEPKSGDKGLAIVACECPNCHQKIDLLAKPAQVPNPPGKP